MKYINFRQLRAKIGNRSRSAIYLDIEAGRLPKPFKLGGVNFWVETEIDDCLQSMADAAGQQ
ncbi:MAG: AlpA family phage regulatory protein [Alphaproteobacteria bacterium]|jgi:prophage regulatory protein|nr:AlpA family phage regulatory protein [Alphaproteobacteria bacterium]